MQGVRGHKGVCGWLLLRAAAAWRCMVRLWSSVPLPASPNVCIAAGAGVSKPSFVSALHCLLPQDQQCVQEAGPAAVCPGGAAGLAARCLPHIQVGWAGGWVVGFSCVHVVLRLGAGEVELAGALYCASERSWVCIYIWVCIYMGVHIAAKRARHLLAPSTQAGCLLMPPPLPPRPTHVQAAGDRPAAHQVRARR